MNFTVYFTPQMLTEVHYYWRRIEFSPRYATKLFSHLGSIWLLCLCTKTGKLYLVVKPSAWTLFSGHTYSLVFRFWSTRSKRVYANNARPNSVFISMPSVYFIRFSLGLAERASGKRWYESYDITSQASITVDNALNNVLLRGRYIPASATTENGLAFTWIH